MHQSLGVLGYKAHMGAGAVTSNVKSDKSLVVVHAEDKEVAGSCFMSRDMKIQR